MVRSTYIINVIWYGRRRPNFGGSGHAFECNGLLMFLMMLSLHHFGQIIIYHHCHLVWETTSQFWGLWSHFWMQWVTNVFDDAFFTSLWSDHHISSFYLVWEMMSQPYSVSNTHPKASEACLKVLNISSFFVCGSRHVIRRNVGSYGLLSHKIGYKKAILRYYLRAYWIMLWGLNRAERLPCSYQ